MKTNKILVCAALLAASFTSFAQVGVGTTSPQAGLDITSDKGMLLPRMADHTTLVPVDGTLDATEEGLQVYNTTTNKVMLYDGTQWVEASGSTGKFVDGTDPLNAVYMDGNVGIGTAVPIAPLHVVGPAWIQRDINNSFGTIYAVNEDLGLNAAPGVSFNQKNTSGTVDGGSRILSYRVNHDLDATRLDFIVRTANATIGHNDVGLQIVGDAVAVPGATYGANTKVGIGTNSANLPTAKLHVRGNGTTATTKALLITDSANANIVTVLDNGNVGIGSSNPIRALEIKRTVGGAYLQLESPAASEAQLFFRGARSWNMGNINTGSFALYDNTSTAFRLLVNASGDIGVGKTVPSAKLDVNGYVRLGIADTTGDATPQNGMLRYNSTSNKFQGYAAGAWVDLH